jgi:hypothetical protein
VLPKNFHEGVLIRSREEAPRPRSSTLFQMSDLPGLLASAEAHSNLSGNGIKKILILYGPREEADSSLTRHPGMRSMPSAAYAITTHPARSRRVQRQSTYL